MRAVLDAVAPDVLLITETNVPHEENISYFGDGSDEAQLVYQFPLPPLVVDAFHQQSARTLTDWADALAAPPGNATFFNFLASHDGIGLRPIEGLLSRSRVDEVVERTLCHGGRVSYRHEPDGREQAYELNISFFDALSDPQAGETEDRQVRRFLTAEAIMLALAGVPGIYFHSMFGSRNWNEGVEKRGTPRAINREKLDRDTLVAELHDPGSLRAKIYQGHCAILRARSATPAFHPRAAQRVLRLDDRVFALLRNELAGDPALCLHNVSGETVSLRLDLAEIGHGASARLVALLGPAPQISADSLSITLAPHDTAWMAVATE
jgi:sucrose phosphorylase